MSDRLEDLIKEVEALLGKSEEEKPSEQADQPEQNVAYQQQESYEAEEQDEYQQIYQKAYWENWKNLGRSVFINKYAPVVPNIGKYLPFIEQRAELKFRLDEAQGKVKDSYDKYLDEAFKEIHKELEAISKDYVDISKTFILQESLSKQVAEKPYTIKDYRNDYKKMLEYATYKDVAEIYYKDGSEKGKYGEPKLRLGEGVNEINI